MVKKTIKLTAIQNEHQSKNDIIEKIIDILLSNKDMSVSYGKCILKETMCALESTPFIK